MVANCIVCLSSIYGFWFSFTASDSHSDIFKLFFHGLSLVGHYSVFKNRHRKFNSFTFHNIIWGRCNLKRPRRTVICLPVYKISSLKITPPKTPNSGHFSYPLPNIVSFLFRLEFRFRSRDFSFNLFPVWLTLIILRPLSALSLDEGLNALSGKIPSGCWLVQPTNQMSDISAYAH
jgi:hypothetical protein